MRTAHEVHGPHAPDARPDHAHATQGGPGHTRKRFVRHYMEMVVAMLVGMAVVGPAVRGLLALAGLELPAGYPELTALEMGVAMSVGMVVWMRHRSYGWASTLEMAGAMFVPAVALFPLLWLGVLDGGSLLALEHLAMLPLMYLVMLRRRSEYGA